MKHSIYTKTIKAYMYVVLFLESILYTCPVYYFNINLSVFSFTIEENVLHIFYCRGFACTP